MANQWAVFYDEWLDEGDYHVVPVYAGTEDICSGHVLADFCVCNPRKEFNEHNIPYFTHNPIGDETA